MLGAKERKDGYLQGNGYLVSWCIGHLLEPAKPDAYGYVKWRYADLPIIPREWKHEAAKEKKKQLGILAALMNRADVSEVINACDAGREGELIFRLVYEYANCKKHTKRLWISSMEETAIHAGLASMKDGAYYDKLGDAALFREKADWLVGINMTRLFSTLYGPTLHIGRVQSPTLAMLVEREAEIAAFKQEPFYTAEIDCGAFTASSERIMDKSLAEAIQEDCNGRNAIVVFAERRDKTCAPPKLYDLTALQREANRYYGYTAKETLDYAQALYEKRLATYPRTDSRYLTEDMEAGLPALIAVVKDMLPFTVKAHEADIGQVIDTTKVRDHHALIPTMSIASADLQALPKGERNILYMMSARLICAVSEKHVFENTDAVLECAGNIFSAKGKSVLTEGWKTYDAAFRSYIKAAPTENAEEAAMPKISEGQSFSNVRVSIKEGLTRPPKRFTEDTLLALMASAGAEETERSVERRGIGTAATRAAIIEKLIKTGMATREKKSLIPTQNAIHLIAILPDALKSAQLTAEWENMLLRVEKGETSGETFLNGISAMITDAVKSNNAPKPEYAKLFATNAPKDAGVPLGSCPRCGAPVREAPRGFFCDERNCGFKIWSDGKFFTSKRKTPDAALVTVLLKEGRCAVSGLYSQRTGKTYDAVIVLDDTGKHVNFKLDFNHRDSGQYGGGLLE